MSRLNSECFKEDVCVLVSSDEHYRDWVRECVTCMPPPSSNKAAHPGFETQRRRHQKYKTGVSVAPQKGLQIFLKKIRLRSQQ